MDPDAPGWTVPEAQRWPASEVTGGGALSLWLTRPRAPLRTLIGFGENLKSRMEIADDGVPDGVPAGDADAVVLSSAPPQPAARAAAAVTAASVMNMRRSWSTDRKRPPGRAQLGLAQH